ncbi:hypothetical protein [Clostridium sp. LP20]|uniref:hypothetical protein n=1 Tax=Clostridium sp. LP20 TaxID=3418665 RepID=UPI003EE46C13
MTTREEVLNKAKDFKECSEICFEYEVKDSDTEFFEYVINLLERTAPEVPVQDSLIKLILNGKVIAEYIIKRTKTKHKYEEKVRDICDNRLIGFKSKKEDAQLIAKIIETLAGEEYLTISHAQSILSDVQSILPMIVKL